MHKFYFCVDYEEWYHTSYLQKYNFDKNQFDGFANKILDFMQWLIDNGIYATVFVVADIAKENSDVLKKIKEMGHKIGCHSLHHELINELTNDEFLQETMKAKQIIEDVIGSKIDCYRAPAFSLTDEKLEILEKIGFKIDSSYIKSDWNKRYNVLSLEGFEKIDSLVYKKDDFLEYEIPTLNGKPIAGGGFFRLYPFWLYKSFIKKYLKNNDNYIFFIHPMEIAGELKFEGANKLKLVDRFHFQIGRKGALKKIKKMIILFQEYGFEFKKIGE